MNKQNIVCLLGVFACLPLPLCASATVRRTEYERKKQQTRVVVPQAPKPPVKVGKKKTPVDTGSTITPKLPVMAEPPSELEPVFATAEKPTQSVAAPQVPIVPQKKADPEQKASQEERERKQFEKISDKFFEALQAGDISKMENIYNYAESLFPTLNTIPLLEKNGKLEAMKGYGIRHYYAAQPIGDLVGTLFIDLEQAIATGQYAQIEKALTAIHNKTEDVVKALDLPEGKVGNRMMFLMMRVEEALTAEEYQALKKRFPDTIFSDFFDTGKEPL